MGKITKFKSINLGLIQDFPGGHPHCMLHKDQYPEVEAFIDKFLLGKAADTTDIGISPDFKNKTSLEPWIKW